MKSQSLCSVLCVALFYLFSETSGQTSGPEQPMYARQVTTPMPAPSPKKPGDMLVNPRQAVPEDAIPPPPSPKVAGIPRGPPQPRQSYQCGQGASAARSSDVERIVNGTLSVQNKYPFMANLKYLQGGGHFCGGAIYDKNTVITAAHCVNGKDFSRIKMSFGDWNQREEEEGEVKILASGFTMHEMYKNHDSFVADMFDDIAIIKLSTPLEWSDQIQPICLPSREATAGEMCTVIGWGATENTGDKNTLRDVNVPVVSRGVCTVDMDIPWYFLQDKQICAGYAEGLKDSCQGDSGGPLFTVRDGFYELVGLVSWGYGCAEPMSPGVYQNVFRYLDWIPQTAGAPVY